MASRRRSQGAAAQRYLNTVATLMNLNPFCAGKPADRAADGYRT